MLVAGTTSEPTHRAGDDEEEYRPAMMRSNTGRALRRRKRTCWGEIFFLAVSNGGHFICGVGISTKSIPRPQTQNKGRQSSPQQKMRPWQKSCPIPGLRIHVQSIVRGEWGHGGQVMTSPAHRRPANEVGERERHSKWPSSLWGMIEQQLNNK